MQEKKFLMPLRAEYFQYKQKRKGLKVLTPKQMLQRLPIALAQVQAGNTPKNLLNAICQILYSLYQAKEII